MPRLENILMLLLRLNLFRPYNRYATKACNSNPKNIINKSVLSIIFKQPKKLIK